MKIDKNPKGKKIYFYDDNHTYYTDDGKMLISSTTFVDKFFPKFEKYKWAAICAKKRNQTTQEVLNEWNKINKESIVLGKGIHSFAENYLINQKINRASTIKERNCRRLLQKEIDEYLKEYNIVWVEKIIFNEKIAGTFDLMLQHKKTKKYLLIDFKTNKQIKVENKYENGLKPIDHLNNCNYSHYSLQLSLYKWLLETEKYLNNDIQIVIWHVHEKGVDKYYPEYLKKEIEDMFNLY